MSSVSRRFLHILPNASISTPLPVKSSSSLFASLNALDAKATESAPRPSSRSSFRPLIGSAKTSYNSFAIAVNSFVASSWVPNIISNVFIQAVLTASLTESTTSAQVLACWAASKAFTPKSSRFLTSSSRSLRPVSDKSRVSTKSLKDSLPSSYLCFASNTCEASTSYCSVKS